jgi:hypothetical protein
MDLNFESGSKIVRAIFFAVDSHFLRFGLASAGSGATRKAGVACGGVIIFCRFGFVQIRVIGLSS